jgi:hypothetical protein
MKWSSISIEWSGVLKCNEGGGITEFDDRLAGLIDSDEEFGGFQLSWITWIKWPLKHPQLIFCLLKQENVWTI